jgi:serine/threonine-protein kinase
MSERIGRYELVSHLASGGMGQVYLARASGMGGFVRHVVLKTLDLAGTDEDDAIAMFLDEARLLGLLHHQHIAPVYEVGKDDQGQLFLVMDYIHGHTAHDVWLRTLELGAALPIDFSLTVAAAAASGLHYAHTRRAPDGRALQIVHRDVSLSNLMVGFDGGVTLIDFGIAKAANRRTQTQVGFIKGKLGYMAPEQLRGHAVDARTDVFALGIVLYELSTMRRAFREESDRATMDRIKAGALVPPSTVVPEYPVELERIVARALRVDPRERYPDAESMRRELDLLGHRLGLVLGDAAIVEVMTQLFEHRQEPWQRPARPETELEVPLEVVPRAVSEDDHTRPTPAQRAPLRAATQATESQLETPPHGVPKRPSAFKLEPTDPRRAPDAAPAAAAAAAEPRARGAGAAPEPAAAPPSTRPDRDTDGVPLAEPLPVPAPREDPPPPRRRAAAAAAVPLPAPAARGRRRPLRWIAWLALALALTAAVAGGLYIVVGPAPPRAAGPGGAPAAAAADRAAPRAAAPAATAAGSAAPRAEPPAARPPIVLPPNAPLRVRIRSVPSDATVVLGGKRLGRTPYVGTIPAAPGVHSLKLRKRGYAPVEIDVALDRDLDQEITLQRARDGAAP